MKIRRHSKALSRQLSENPTYGDITFFQSYLYDNMDLWWPIFPFNFSNLFFYWNKVFWTSPYHESQLTEIQTETARNVNLAKRLTYFCKLPKCMMQISEIFLISKVHDRSFGQIDRPEWFFFCPRVWEVDFVNQYGKCLSEIFCRCTETGTSKR